ncbi:MAG: long-chain fatty acid--CoA ligase [Chthonomonadales bacterium]|nr:long-chain fatty acid--CoA ligase [Chthonomonadales bacterium]
MAEQTIYQMLRESARRFESRRALGYKEDGAYRYLTYGDVWRRVRSFRRGLASLGVRRGDRIALLSYNRVEWAIADLTAQSLGVVTVPIYHTLPVEQVEYLVRDSASRVLIVEDARQLVKAQELRPRVRTLEHVVVMRGPAAEDVLRFDEVLARGGPEGPMDDKLDRQAEEIAPDEVATLIYTSGTTGDPKGAMLSHRALLHTGTAAREFVRLDETDVFLSFLPLCHIVERVGGHYLPLSVGALIVYSEGPFAVAGEIADVRPTVFLCVPRLYENVQEKVMEHAARLPARRRRVFGWAMRVGREYAERRSRGATIGPALALQRRAADQIVLEQVRRKATGGRVRFLVSGGAPLGSETALFFESIGVTILEGYGLTECPVIALNRPGRSRLGTVGEPLPGLEARIADDGEIHARGPSLMRGYFGKPEATAEAIDGEGWFNTGDIGEIGPGGFLRITDRKKDIIVLANGKNVAPQPIEARLKRSPYIQEAVLIGDRQSVMVAIVVPAFDRLRHWAAELGVEAASAEALAAHPDVKRLIKAEIDRCSEGLADFERVRRFALVDHAFTIDGGELTPTLKVRRREVARLYAPLIEQLVR